MSRYEAKLRAARQVLASVPADDLESLIEDLRRREPNPKIRQFTLTGLEAFGVEKRQAAKMVDALFMLAGAPRSLIRNCNDRAQA